MCKAAALAKVDEGKSVAHSETERDPTDEQVPGNDKGPPINDDPIVRYGI